MIDCDPSHPLNQPVRPKSGLQRRQAEERAREAEEKQRRAERRLCGRAERQMRLWARQDALNKLPEPMEANQ